MTPIILGTAIIGLILVMAFVYFTRPVSSGAEALKQANRAYDSGDWIDAIGHLKVAVEQTRERRLSSLNAGSTLEAIGVFENLLLELGFDRPEWVAELKESVSGLLVQGADADPLLLNRLNIFLSRADRINRHSTNVSLKDTSEAAVVQQNLMRVFGAPEVVVSETPVNFTTYEESLDHEVYRRLQVAS